MGSTGKGIEPVLVTPLRSPRARRRSRAQSHLVWRRTAVRLLVGGVVLAALVRVGSIAVEPLVASYRSGREIQALEAQYRAELARRSHLQREIQFLSTRAGIEEEARRLGWVKDGETSLQIILPAGVPAPAAPPRKRSGSERVKHWLETWFSLLNREPRSGTRPAGAAPPGG